LAFRLSTPILRHTLIALASVTRIIAHRMPIRTPIRMLNPTLTADGEVGAMVGTSMESADPMAGMTLMEAMSSMAVRGSMAEGSMAEGSMAAVATVDTAGK
jgi:hypothetical protein